MRAAPHAGSHYANVTATLALFVALGGTGYAAISLPRDSVGSRELRPGAVGQSELRSDAVTSSNVRDGSLTVRDLSPAARVGAGRPAGSGRSTRAGGRQGRYGSYRSDRSQRAATGLTGDTGPPGVDAVSEWAVIDSSDGRFAGTATGSSSPAIGEIVVSFARSAAGCASVATLARVPGGLDPDPPAGRITVATTDDGCVFVRTYDEDGFPDDFGFHLIVVCS